MNFNVDTHYLIAPVGAGKPMSGPTMPMATHFAAMGVFELSRSVPVDDEPSLDFSRFHATSDHWPFTKYCRQFYGGGWHHLKLAWEFHRRDQVLRPIRKHTLCLIGKHKWDIWKTGRTPWWSKELGQPSDYRPLCRYCRKTRTATEDEWW